MVITLFIDKQFENDNDVAADGPAGMKIIFKEDKEEHESQCLGL